MHQDDKYFYWKKGEEVQLSEHFNSSEFSCHCNYKSCVEQKISKDYINRLQLLRNDVKKTITITSGFRCSKYQKQLAEHEVSTVVAVKSQHELGEAGDIVCAIPIKTFDKAASNYFFAIGTGAAFLHVDTRPKKADGTYRRWKY